MIHIPGVIYSRTEQGIMDRLSDGSRHPVKDFLPEDLADFKSEKVAFQAHIGRIRKKLDGTGYEIIAEYNRRRLCYRLVRLITSI